MSYLYLDFSKYLQEGIKRKDDMYALSLTEQFLDLNRRYLSRISDITSLQEFIQYTFPSEWSSLA